MSWSIGCVRTGSELSLAERLFSCGVGNYVPMGKTRVRRARRRSKSTLSVPAFPGYMFLSAETVTDRIYDEPGFYGFIRLNGERYHLSSDAVDQIRTMEARGMFDSRHPGRPEFTIGEILRVKEGVFAGYTGVVERVRGAHVWLAGRDFTKPLRLNGLNLLQTGVVCAA